MYKFNRLVTQMKWSITLDCPLSCAHSKHLEEDFASTQRSRGFIHADRVVSYVYV
ncbi:MAG: hypothetical protein GFH27_549287n264 [Chloroflexi bacterium AL-W]|nr:hypothetical protein [Chloroflexi bacterium AL-N1]NOK66538.1 hypothetical protein [Chloroflexi bacterium AL-N10]NOK71926.1 hypothetical protein [Chloroflexi bacterium AL-N5]NOK81183.1 hypothetical protein [Chloroflexi bacterium AL-W]NOK89456.1 hypothetical protein [Chloroflexi bacterium AL-N15]